MYRPEIGSLVRLKSWNNEHYVKVAAHTPDCEDTYALVPYGSTAMIIGYHTRECDKRDIVPVISVGSVSGWIFMDEWESLNDAV